MSKINELNEKLIVVLQEKIKLLEDQKEISKKIAKIQEEQLIIADVSICLERAKKYARHQHFLGTQGKDLVEFEDWVAKD